MLSFDDRWLQNECCRYQNGQRRATISAMIRLNCDCGYFPPSKQTNTALVHFILQLGRMVAKFTFANPRWNRNMNFHGFPKHLKRSIWVRKHSLENEQHFFFFLHPWPMADIISKVHRQFSINLNQNGCVTDGIEWATQINRLMSWPNCIQYSLICSWLSNSRNSRRCSRLLFEWCAEYEKITERNPAVSIGKHFH